MAAKVKAKTKGKHGGSRTGAGRKKTRDVDPGRVKAAEGKIRDKLPELVDNLFKLAKGGFKRVEEEWTPFDPDEDELRAILAGAGPPPDLVLAKRKVSVAEPDRAANQYLIDRVLGRPGQKIEADVTSGGLPFQTLFFIPENGRDAACDPEPDADHPAPAGAADGVAGEPG